MELFPAGNDEKWRLIQRVISECDYYVLVIGGKYGSLDPATELSYTEMEFDYAESIGKPIMAFLHGEPGKLAGDQLELDSARREKLDAFREKVEAARVVKYWNTPAELPGHVALALMETREHYPAEGWIRANQAMTPEVRTELAELRARVAELVQQTESRSSSTFAMVEDLAQGDDEYPLEMKVTGYKSDQVDPTGQLLDARAPRWIWTVHVPVTWNDVLQVVGPTLLHEASEPEVFQAIQRWIRDQWPIEGVLPDDFGKQAGTEIVSPGVVEDVLVQLFALGVIARGSKKRTVSDKGKYWALTDLGQDQMMKLRAIRRSSTS